MRYNNIISRIKSLFGKKSRAKNSALNLDKIWKMEVVLASILLASFLAFDFWIYQNFVAAEQNLTFDKDSVILFRKSTVERAVKKIDDYADFLKNPSFPFAENPF